MVFTLEALKARHGDALLLHYGEADAPGLALIDGGPSGVWATLSDRLEQLRSAGERGDWLKEGQLSIDLAAVTHLDDDHVHGILDLSGDLVELQDQQQPAPWKVGGLWLNHFEKLAGESDQLRAAPAVAMQELSVAAPDEGIRGAAAVLASIPQGRSLIDNARKLGWLENPGFDGGLVMAPDEGGKQVPLDAKAKVTVVAPMASQIEELRRKWEEYMRSISDRAAAATELAEYVDRSVYNLSSIVALVEADKKRMLLTGDARGDQIIEGLRAANRLDDDGKIAVDLLKLPHHGSSRNVTQKFFETVRADHYVVSGDGNYGNPETETLKMLSAARPDDGFTIHLTYRESDSLGTRLVDFFASEARAGRRYGVEFRDDSALSLCVNLLDPVEF